MRTLAATLIVTMASVTALTACGLRGPLYLPEDRARTEAERATPVPTESGKLVVPQPAPQAQKKDRAASPAEPAAAPLAN